MHAVRAGASNVRASLRLGIHPGHSCYSQVSSCFEGVWCPGDFTLPGTAHVSRLGKESMSLVSRSQLIMVDGTKIHTHTHTLEKPQRARCKTSVRLIR